ncbi:hypothetical protein PENTCL1PPCAC_20448, partial [Pristionchus entomophagus]
DAFRTARVRHGDDGQLGIRASGNEVNAPEHIVGAPSGHDGCTVVDVASGEKHTMFLAEDGKLWSVGWNKQGQLGRGDSSAGSYTINPIPVPTSPKFVQISAGRAHTAAITEDGRLFVWGCNVHGQCGVSGQVGEAQCRFVEEINEAIQVACGPDDTIVLMESGRIYTFGQQHDGACLHEPAEITEFIGMPIVSVQAGGPHWAALSACGTVVTWGKNEYGQLATNDTMVVLQSEQIDSLSKMRVVDIALGDSHSLFLTVDGRVFVRRQQLWPDRMRPDDRREQHAQGHSESEELARDAYCRRQDSLARRDGGRSRLLFRSQRQRPARTGIREESAHAQTS